MSMSEGGARPWRFAGTAVGGAVRLFVSLRRYLARNHPYLWQIRLHTLIGLFVTFTVVWPALAFVMPLNRYTPPDPAAWQIVLFLLSFVCVLYWAFSYYFVLDPGSMPTTIREPAASILILCSILLLLPSYGFLAVANHRLVQAFPDVAYEEDATAVLKVLASYAGDRQGIFRGALPPGPYETPDGKKFKAEYSIAPDGLIGPPAKADSRKKQFEAELVCKIGDQFVRKLASSNRFSLQSSAGNGNEGMLVPIGLNAVSAPSKGPLFDLAAAYVDTLKFQIEGVDDTNRTTPLCVHFPDKLCSKPAITVSVDCKAMATDKIASIFGAISRAAQSLLRDYVAPMSEAELARMTSEILAPFCEVGKRVDDCSTAYRAAMEVAEQIKVPRLEKRLNTIKTAYGSEETVTAFEARISSASTDQPLREFAVAPKTKLIGTTEGATLSGSWLGAWLFIVSLLAISAKTFRLVRETSANYVFAALFLVPGIILGAVFGGDLINAGTARLGKYFGWNWLSFSINADKVLFAYLVITLVYITWQVTRRRCSHLARLIATFNLFFLLVLSFYFPFIEFPWIGKVGDLQPWAVVLAFILYFGVLYDICYALARWARERPA